MLANIERAQEARTLIAEEVDFKRYLKAKALGWQRFKKPKRDNILDLLGFARATLIFVFFSSFMQMQEEEKDYISTLNSDSGVVISQVDRAKAANDFFPHLGLIWMLLDLY
jgi:hypothetical protein